MIVPRSRLLLWVAIVVLPFSLLAAVEPGAATPSLLALGAFLALAAADALAARRSLAGITLGLPALARMAKDREAQLELRLANQTQAPRLIRLALALPKEIHSPSDEALVSLPASGEIARVHWRCLPRRRGNFRAGPARLETSSPLGFWSTRQSVPAQTEIRVYPDLSAERKNLAALFLHRSTFGLHSRRQVGKGREFEKLRDYLPGDSYDEIHWKATAKRGRPITKVFQVERTQEVYVVVDASRLSARPLASPSPRAPLSTSSPALPSAPPSPPTISNQQPATGGPQLSALSTTALDRFLAAALTLGLAAEQQGDLFGVLTFTNRVEKFVRAGNGKAHYSACREALYALQPQIVTPDYEEVFTFIRLRLRRRALLLFLTSLDDPALAESFVRDLNLLRGHHLVLVNMPQPPGVAPAFSSPDVATVDDLYQRLGGHLLWHNLRELEKVLQRRGVQFSLLKSERLAADLVSQYLEVKRRQLL